MNADHLHDYIGSQKDLLLILLDDKTEQSDAWTKVRALDVR